MGWMPALAWGAPADRPVPARAAARLVGIFGVADLGRSLGVFRWNSVPAVGPGCTDPGYGGWIGEPDFVGAPSDFTLAAGSPLLDAGDPDDDADDADGSRNDIGMYGGPEGAGQL
jgi:hypothetical protein